MKPLPKWIGALAAIAAGASVIAAATSIVSPTVALIAAAVGAAVAAFSHSLQGTGGSPSNP